MMFCNDLLQIWAYANMGYDPGALLDAVAQHCEQRLREFSPQHVSNILWAYAKLGKPAMQQMNGTVTVVELRILLNNADAYTQQGTVTSFR